MLSITAVAEKSRRETLAEYVKRVRGEKNMSLSEVESESRRKGAPISNAYISQIENGQMKNPSLSALIGLAKGLGVPEDDVIDAARGRTRDKEAESAAAGIIGELDEAHKILALRLLDTIRLTQGEATSQAAGADINQRMISVPHSTATPRRKKPRGKKAVGS